MTELRDCPFCGETPGQIERTVGDVVITCECGVEMYDGDFDDDDDESSPSVEAVRQRWNTRSYDGLVGELVEATATHECGLPSRRGRTVGQCAEEHQTYTSGRCVTCRALTRAREAGYGGNLQKMQTTQGSE